MLTIGLVSHYRDNRERSIRHRQRERLIFTGFMTYDLSFAKTYEPYIQILSKYIAFTVEKKKTRNTCKKFNTVNVYAYIYIYTSTKIITIVTVGSRSWRKTRKNKKKNPIWIQGDTGRFSLAYNLKSLMFSIREKNHIFLYKRPRPLYVVSFRFYCAYSLLSPRRPLYTIKHYTLVAILHFVHCVVWNPTRINLNNITRDLHYTTADVYRW